jgi:hypothetical protein
MGIESSYLDLQLPDLKMYLNQNRWNITWRQGQPVNALCNPPIHRVCVSARLGLW